MIADLWVGVPITYCPFLHLRGKTPQPHHKQLARNNSIRESSDHVTPNKYGNVWPPPESMANVQHNFHPMDVPSQAKELRIHYSFSDRKTHGGIYELSQRSGTDFWLPTQNINSSLVP